MMYVCVKTFKGQGLIMGKQITKGRESNKAKQQNKSIYVYKTDSYPRFHNWKSKYVYNVSIQATVCEEHTVYKHFISTKHNNIFQQENICIENLSNISPQPTCKIIRLPKIKISYQKTKRHIFQIKNCTEGQFCSSLECEQYERTAE